MECRAFQTVEPADRRAKRASLLAFVGFVGLCLLAWLADGAVAAGAVRAWFAGLARPPLSPPLWLFGPVRLSPIWLAFDLSLGLAAWLVWRRIAIAAHRKRAALRLWGWQVLAGAAWPSLLFGLRSTGLGFGAGLILLTTAAATVWSFWPLQRRAALLLLPGLAWTAFITYLTFGIWWLNPV